jgi:hypothetical protein
MNLVLGRRLLAGAAAAVAAVAVAAPAQAAGIAVELLIPDVTVAAGGNTFVSPILFAEQNAELAEAKIVYELSGDLDGVALAAPDQTGDCVSDGPAKLTCTPAWSSVGPDGGLTQFNQVTATKAALGEKGKLTVTFTADGISAAKRTVDVNVAEGVDLAAGKTHAVTAKPGANFEAPVQVTNTTDTVVHGTALLFGTDYAFAGVKQFSNCFYDDDLLNACTFDEDLQPGATYEVVLPYQLRKDTAAPGESVGEFGWLTAGDYDDLIKFVDDSGFDGPGDPGNGGKLTLKQLTGTKALAKQTDPNPENNWQDVNVTVVGKQGVDLAAIGATATGAAGDTVAVLVGVKDNGPAALDQSQSGLAAALVTIPAGATVTTVPDGCFRNTSDSILKGDPTAIQYACFADTVLPVGTSTMWKFGLKITKVVPNATGAVQLNPSCECDLFSDDTNRANDNAKIVLNPVAGAGTGSGDGGTGGEGGGLPVTGPQTAFLGLAGALLVAAGVTGFAVTRRRRTRFEA